MKNFCEQLPPPRPTHPYAWLWEPLAEEPRFVLRTMFGAKAAYLDGRIVLGFATGKEPWLGLLVPTDRAHHDALRAEFPAFVVHPILGKWLYLPESSDAFERSAAALVQLVRRRDPRVGVMPRPKKRRPNLTPSRGEKTAARPTARRKPR
jgi:hypothetical protein